MHALSPTVVQRVDQILFKVDLVCIKLVINNVTNHLSIITLIIK